MKRKHSAGLFLSGSLVAMTLGRAGAFPMNGGDGANSYMKNSSIQGCLLSACKEKIWDCVERDDDVVKFMTSGAAFHIADLGCSVGPNTFMAVENILQALEMKHLSAFSRTEFQVFFNDHVSNDFNTLFGSLPADRSYYAAAVPGSFHGRLFPASSLHVAHSSSAIHWLSRVPKEIVDRSDSARWNGGRIHYSDAPEGVVQAYASQFSRDMSAFLSARAAEIVAGGLLLLILPGSPDVFRPSQCSWSATMLLLEACLVDLAREGRMDVERVDSFNLPLYFPCLKEVLDAVRKNGGFTIVRAESYPADTTLRGLWPSAGQLSQNMRAAFESLLAVHFGNEIIDEVFHSLKKKLTDTVGVDLSSLRLKASVELFVTLKRAL